MSGGFGDPSLPKYVCGACGGDMVERGRHIGIAVLNNKEPFTRPLCSRCFIAVSTYQVLTCPIEELPLLINHELDGVKAIAKHRLDEKGIVLEDAMDENKLLEDAYNKRYIKVPASPDIRALVRYALHRGYAEGIRVSNK